MKHLLIFYEDLLLYTLTVLPSPKSTVSMQQQFRTWVSASPVLLSSDSLFLFLFLHLSSWCYLDKLLPLVQTLKNYYVFTPLCRGTMRRIIWDIFSPWIIHVTYLRVDIKAQLHAYLLILLKVKILNSENDTKVLHQISIKLIFYQTSK